MHRNEHVGMRKVFGKQCLQQLLYRILFLFDIVFDDSHWIEHHFVCCVCLCVRVFVLFCFILFRVVVARFVHACVPRPAPRSFGWIGARWARMGGV